MTAIETEAGTLQKGSAVGQSVPRKEDGRLVQGQGVFFDDVKRKDMGYLHFVRSPYAHATIESIDVSAALEMPGVYGTLTGDEVAILTDPFFQIAAPPGGHVKDYALAVGKVRYLGEPVVAVVAETRELARTAAEYVMVEYEPLDVLVDARAALADGAPVLARGVRRQPLLLRRLGVGRRRRGVRRGRPRRLDRRAPLRPLQLDTARVRRRARRVQPRHRAVDDVHEQPVPRVRGDHDGPGDARRARQAAHRHPGHRRRLRQQDHVAPAARRLLPARAQAQAGDPVDGVADRVPPVDVARQRALVREHRGRGQGRRHAARLQDEGDRRRRRVPPLRAARRRDLVAGRGRDVQVAQHPARVHAGDDEQGARVAEPRLLAHAAALVHRARDRHRRADARLRSGRDPPAQLRAARGHAVRDAERLRLRLRRLPAGDGHGARADRRVRHRDAAGRGSIARQAPRARHRLDARLGHEQLRPVAADQPRAAVLRQQRGRDGQARHLRRGRRHARHDAAGAGARDDGRAGRRRHPPLRRRHRERAGRPRQLLELACRLLGHVREPVRRHRPRAPSRAPRTCSRARW